MCPRASTSSLSATARRRKRPPIFQRLGRPHVGDRVRPLVGRPVVRRLRPRSRVEGSGEKRFCGVADDVESGRGGHLSGQRARQVGVDDSLRRSQVAMRNPGLDLDLRKVKDSDRRRLRAGSRRGGDRQMRLQSRGRPLPLADWRVDVVHHRSGMRGHEVCDLGGVDAGAAAHRNEAVHVVLESEVGGVLERIDRRLDPRAVVEHDLDPLTLDQSLDPLRVTERGHSWVCHQHRPPHPQTPQLPSRVGGGSGAELHRRGLHREYRLVIGSRRCTSPCRFSRGCYEQDYIGPRRHSCGCSAW